MKLFNHILFFFLLTTQICFGQWFWQNPLPQGNDLTAVYIIDANTRTAVGLNGTIIRTTDGGANWTMQTSGTPNDFYGICFSNANTGTIVGAGGTILNTTNGGVSFVEEEQIDEIPVEFLLSNNFPNPFNPSTKIKYSVPLSSNVELKVYDVLGNEIETLVNEEKLVDSYEITWNAGQLPSGVYFYQLKAGDFISTKKMILMK